MVRRHLAGRLRRPCRCARRSASTDSRAERCMQVERLTLVRREREVALDHQRLGDRGVAGEAELGGDRAFVHVAVARERRLLAVQREAPAGDRRVLERAPHQARRERTGQAVVGEAGGAGVGELAHLRQLARPACPFVIAARKPTGIVRLGSRVLDQRAEHRGRVDDRLGVRHGEDRAVAAGRSRGGAATRSSPRPRAPASAGGRAGRRRPARARGRVPSITRWPFRSSECRSRRSRRRRRGRRRGASIPSPGSRTRAPRHDERLLRRRLRWRRITRPRRNRRRCGRLDEHGPVREQVVEHRHPDDEPRPNLRHDQRVLIVGDLRDRSRRRGSSGPGCMIFCPGRSRSGVTPQRAVYSRRLGTKFAPSSIRSFCMRRT